MNWDAIGAIGQGVSALALVLVLVQLRHAREQMQASARQSRFEPTRDVFLAQATNPQLASTLQKLFTSTGMPLNAFMQFVVRHGGTEGEARQAYSFTYTIWLGTEGTIETIGRLSSGVRREVDRRIVANFQTNSVGAKWYELSKPDLNPDAVRYVDKVLAERAAPAEPRGRSAPF